MDLGIQEQYGEGLKREMFIKKLFVIILFLSQIIIYPAFSQDTYTANYNLRLIEFLSRDWGERLSRDIISIDAILNMVSRDSGWTGNSGTISTRPAVTQVAIRTGLSVDNNLTISQDLYVTRRVIIGPNAIAPRVSLDVIGNTDITGILSVDSSVGISRDLIVYGLSNISGDVSIGTGNTNTGLFIGIPSSVSSSLRLQTASGADSNDTFIDTYDAGSGYNRVFIRRSKGASIGNIAETLNADNIGQIIFQGTTSGNTFAQGANILALQSGSSGATDVPTVLRFSTSTNAGSAERLSIDNLRTRVFNRLSVDVGLTISAETTATVGGAVGRISVLSSDGVSKAYILIYAGS